jgi:hypothetical protein
MVGCVKVPAAIVGWVNVPAAIVGTFVGHEIVGCVNVPAAIVGSTVNEVVTVPDTRVTAFKVLGA